MFCVKWRFITGFVANVLLVALLRASGSIVTTVKVVITAESRCECTNCVGLLAIMLPQCSVVILIKILQS